jgi:hypothetical protein
MLEDVRNAKLAVIGSPGSGFGSISLLFLYCWFFDDLFWLLNLIHGKNERRLILAKYIQSSSNSKLFNNWGRFPKYSKLAS